MSTLSRHLKFGSHVLTFVSEKRKNKIEFGWAIYQKASWPQFSKSVGTQIALERMNTENLYFYLSFCEPQDHDWITVRLLQTFSTMLWEKRYYVNAILDNSGLIDSPSRLPNSTKKLITSYYNFKSQEYFWEKF